MANVYGRATMVFGGGKWGWEEEVYWLGADGTFAQLLTDTKGLGNARRAFLSKDFSLEAIRVAITDQFGNTFFNQQNYINYQLTDGVGVGLADARCSNPWLALLEHVSSDDYLYKRNLILRGIPSELLCMTGAYAVPFVMDDKLRGLLKDYNAFVGNSGSAVRNGKWMMRVKDQANGRNIAVNVTNVTVNDAGNFVIETAGPIQVQGTAGLRTVQLGDVVHVYAPRAPWARGLAGDHYVISPFDVDFPGVLTLSARQSRSCTVSYNQNAKACGVNHALVQIGKIVPSRPTDKATGNPHFGTRGRRSRAG